MNRAWLIGLVLAASCRQEILVLPDATTGGVDGSTGRDGGFVVDGSIDGGSTSDGGMRDATGADGGLADAGPVTYSVAQFPLTGSLNRAVRVVRVVDIGIVLFGNASGIMGLLETAGPQQVWRTTDNSAIRAIERTPNGAAVLGERGVFEFDRSDFSVPTNSTPLTANALDMSLIDGVGFVSANVNNGQRLYRYEPNQLTSVADLVPGRANTLLTVGPGEVYLGGYGGIRHYKSGALTEMNVQWPIEFDANDIASFQVLDIGRVGNTIHAVGSEQSVLQLEGNTWTFIHRGMAGYDFNAVADGQFYGGESPRADVILQGTEPFAIIELPDRSFVISLDYDTMEQALWVGGYERNGIDGRLFRLSKP